MTHEKMLNSVYLLFSKCPRFLKFILACLINLVLKIYLAFIKTPVFIIFFVTNRCNANCSHCFYRSSLNNGKDELDLEKIKKIARSLKNRNSLLITGGEPFLRDDIVEICKAFYDFGRTKKIRIASNGYLTDKILSFSERLLEHRIDLAIQISLDALGDKHDKLRKLNGLFERATDTIAQLKSLQERFPKLEISITATITRSNYDQVEALSNYVKQRFDLDLGVTLVRELACGVYNLDKKYQSKLSILEADSKLPDRRLLEDILFNRFVPYKMRGRDFIKDFSKLEKRIELDVVFKAKKPPLRCTAGRTDMVVYPNGDVSFCEITKPFGNLENYAYSVYKLWNSKEARYARKKIKRCYCNHPCHLISSMKHNADILLSMGRE